MHCLFQGIESRVQQLGVRKFGFRVVSSGCMVVSSRVKGLAFRVRSIQSKDESYTFIN